MSTPPRVEAIIAEVAAQYRVTPADIVGPRRIQKFVDPRWEAMRRVRDLDFGAGRKASFPQIGRWFGGRDHTTVMHACRQLQEEEA